MSASMGECSLLATFDAKICSTNWTKNIQDKRTERKGERGGRDMRYQKNLTKSKIIFGSPIGMDSETQKYAKNGL